MPRCTCHGFEPGPCKPPTLDSKQARAPRAHQDGARLHLEPVDREGPHDGDALVAAAREDAGHRLRPTQRPPVLSLCRVGFDVRGVQHQHASHVVRRQRRARPRGLDRAAPRVVERRLLVLEPDAAERLVNGRDRKPIAPVRNLGRDQPLVELQYSIAILCSVYDWFDIITGRIRLPNCFQMYFETRQLMQCQI